MTKEKITEQYAITAEQLIEFTKITEKLRKIITNGTKKRNTRMYKDARSVRYGGLK